jgi:hypothetical protein
VRPSIDAWTPLAVEHIQQELGDFHNWCLCGGTSLDWFLGRNTRKHGDTDIGILRSSLPECFKKIGESRVYLCVPSAGLTPWDGNDVPPEVHDIWIADSEVAHWIFQIMVYEEDGDTVVYRRHPSIRWTKSSHTMTVRGISILNPLVTFLFKANGTALEAKDAVDISNLIESFPTLAHETVSG